ncbi:MAG TPA: hypothetical protein VGN73_04760, partial [Gemmatimonadaceae bacterium]|nr:hypothetical protein [Gemmatimonadaceae bacterium]
SSGPRMMFLIEKSNGFAVWANNPEGGPNTSVDAAALVRVNTRRTKVLSTIEGIGSGRPALSLASRRSVPEKGEM